MEKRTKNPISTKIMKIKKIKKSKNLCQNALVPNLNVLNYTASASLRGYIAGHSVLVTAVITKVNTSLK